MPTDDRWDLTWRLNG